MPSNRVSETIIQTDYNTVLEDKDSQKVCVFLSVLMASLFITNMGDIVSEMFGGGLQQSNISDLLKLVCALTFIYCLPVILKHITRIKIFLVFASVLVILFNLMFFNNEQIMDTIATFYSMCFTGFMAADTLRNFALLKQYLIRTSRIIAFFGILVLMLSSFGVITSLQTGGYRMGLGYSCIICVMILFWSFAEYRKAIDIIGGIGLLLLVLLYGSRGPLAGIILFIVYFSIRYFHKKGQDIVCVLLFAVMIVTVVFYKDIVNAVYTTLGNMGITSRSIYLLANQSLNYDSGRSTIYDVLVNEIQKNPFRIRGINAEYAVTKTYAHNIIIEIIYQHGILLGGIALFYVLAKVIDTLRLNIVEDSSVLCLIFMFACIPSLMFSGSLWTSQNFWIWIALINNIYRNKKIERF